MNGIMTIRPPDNLKEILKQAAINKGYTLNGLVLEALWEWAEAHGLLDKAG